MSRDFEEILQEVNVLLTRAEAKPPYTVEWLDKGNEVMVGGDRTFKGVPAGIESDADRQLVADPNIVIGSLRNSNGSANIIQPWATSASMFAGFRGNANLVTQAPNLLKEILDLFVDQPEPEPVPEPVAEPPVPAAKLRKLPKPSISEEVSEI